MDDGIASSPFSLLRFIARMNFRIWEGRYRIRQFSENNFLLNPKRNPEHAKDKLRIDVGRLGGRFLVARKLPPSVIY